MCFVIFQKEDLMKLFRKIREYFATHFASMFVVMLGFVFYVVLSLQQQYLRREYLQYLERQNEEATTEALVPCSLNLWCDIKCC